MGELRFYSIAAIAAAVLASVFAYSALPEKTVTHWNAWGEPDGYGGREVGALAVPAIMMLVYGLFLVIPKIDPFRHNYRLHEREYDGFIAVLMVFMLYVYAATLAYNMGIAFHMGQAIALGTAGLFYYLGEIMPGIRRNFFFGIRTPWTIYSDKVWKKTHELGGLTFKLNAAVMLVGFAFPQYFAVIIIVPLLINALGLVLYSYLEFKKTNKYKPRYSG